MEKNISVDVITSDELIFGCVIFFTGQAPINLLRGDQGVIFVTDRDNSGEFIKSERGWEIVINGETHYTIESEIYDIIINGMSIHDSNKLASKIKELMVRTEVQYKSKIFLSIVYQQLIKLTIFGEISSSYKLQTLPFSLIKTKIGLHISSLN
jgi:hypothetical protein